MPPLSILEDQAFLVSPLEIPVYLLELPDMKDALLEGEIRNRLKALYPGTPEDTVIDYTLCPGSTKTAPRLVVVYVSSCQTGEMYRSLHRPLIPGTVIMRLALGKTGLGSGFCVIATEEWMEAAFFEGPRILRYGSCAAPSAPSGELPLSFIASFVNSGESGQAEAVFVHAGASPEQNEKTEKMLRQFFDPVTIVGINEIPLKGKLKTLGIFNDSRRRKLKRQRRTTGVLVFLNCLSLLFSLHIISERTRAELFQIEKQEKEQSQTLDRAKTLEGEIAELLKNSGAASKDRGTDPYGIIAGLQQCLSGGWIKSLVIQGEKFDLEAEGSDSIGVLQSLQRSGHFGELSLRRASPSPIAGDQFVISGRAENYEKK
jgi:hypothetical protein